MARRLCEIPGTAWYAAQWSGESIGSPQVVGPHGWTGRVQFDPIEQARARILSIPRLRGEGRRKVFVTSMGDLLHTSIPLEWGAGCIDAMAHRDDIDWMIITKRWVWWPYLPNAFGSWGMEPGSWPANVWPGVTAWDQESADNAIPYLLQVPAHVRWLSLEPLLGPVKLGGTIPDVRDVSDLGWVIVGGETGPGARPMSPAWVRSIRDQCVDAGVPFHFKGWGSSSGMKGRLLDGRTWDEVPR